MSDELSLEELFEEQGNSAELFVIHPLNEEFVRMKPWNSTERCVCSGFEKVPRSAVRFVKKTGKTTVCCGKVLQVVAVTFSVEATLTYTDLFAALRRLSSGRRRPRAVSRFFRPRLPIKMDPDDPFPHLWEGGDDDSDGGGIPFGDWADCFEGCMARNPAPANLTPSQRVAHYQQAAALCDFYCTQWLSTGELSGD